MKTLQNRKEVCKGFATACLSGYEGMPRRAMAWREEVCERLGLWRCWVSALAEQAMHHTQKTMR